MKQIAFDFTGTTVIVTGGSGGIGKEITLGFARSGANVVIGDLKEEAGKAVLNEIQEFGGKAIYVATDVTKQESVDHLVQAALNEYGSLDILVNGAGVATRVFGDPFTDLIEEDFIRTYNVNVMGVVHTCRAVFDLFVNKKAGKIINIASVVGHSTNPQNVPYAVSKAGALNLTMNLAKEMGRYGVTVNAVCPGYVLTPMYEAVAPAMILKNPALKGKGAKELVMYLSEQNCALRRPQTVEDIANGVLFLASDGADNITGQILDVSGGYKI